jgi:hypothetical protein
MTLEEHQLGREEPLVELIGENKPEPLVELLSESSSEKQLSPEDTILGLGFLRGVLPPIFGEIIDHQINQSRDQQGNINVEKLPAPLRNLTTAWVRYTHSEPVVAKFQQPPMSTPRPQGQPPAPTTK